MEPHIDKGILRAMNDSHPGMTWLQALSRSGLRSGEGEPGAPAYQLAQRVHEIEDEIDLTYQREEVYFPLPPGWWIWVPLLYSGGFLWAADKDFYEERLVGFMLFCIAFALILGVVLLSKYVRERRILLDRAKKRPRLLGERAAVMVDLMALRDVLVGDSEAPGDLL